MAQLLKASRSTITTRLTDATIVMNMNLHMPHCQDPAQREFTQLLAVSLAYRKVEWEHIKSGTSGADDWRTAESINLSQQHPAPCRCCCT